MENQCKFHEATLVKMERYEKHCNESDKSGGYRDRLVMVESNLKEMREELKRAVTKAGIIGGVIGGLLGTQSSDIITWAFKKVLGG